MRWISTALNRKFAAGTAAGLLISSLVFLFLYIGLYRSELGQERADAAMQVNHLLQTSLENAMLKRDLGGLRHIIHQLGEQPAIERVFITNPKGEIRFSSDARLLGTSQELPGSFNAPTTQLYTADSGQELLRSINPVSNRAECSGCHGSVVQNPLNGVLYVDYDMQPIVKKARDTTLILMSSGALIVLINLIGGWWFMRRYVLNPIHQLGTASARLSQGNLSSRAHLSGSDEFAQLGSDFDTMADQLETTIGELQNQQDFLQSLIDAIPDGVRVIGDDFRILMSNKAYREQLGLVDDDAVAVSCHKSTFGKDEPCSPTLHTCPVIELKQHDKPIKALHRHKRCDGTAMDVEVFAAAMNGVYENRAQRLVVESIRDLAPQVKYSHEQKLAELGRLATGVAHEIYNPLASVRLALHNSRQLLSGDHTDVKEACEYLSLVDRQVDKCIEVTNRLLKLSSVPGTAPELVNVGDIVEETLGLLRWEADGKSISVNVNAQENTRILGTDSELRMIVLNLAQNAFHAMPNGGALTVTIQCNHDGDVEMRIADTGRGIAAADLAHVFDAFFSRRADGSQGTGIGLSITRNIVDKFGGDITVESKVGKGTQFTLRFPDPMMESEVAS